MTTSSENNVTNPRAGLEYTPAAEFARNGFVIARERWLSRGAFVVWAVSGSFIAFDKGTGRLEPHLVAHLNGLYVPYFPTDEDREATDWVAMTRQEADRI